MVVTIYGGLIVMKSKIKSIFKILFGSDEDISFKLGNASFMSGLLLLAFSLMSSTQQVINFFIYGAAICFAIWIILTQDENTFNKMAAESIRLICFLVSFTISLGILINITLNAYNLFQMITFGCIAIILLLCCFYYIISKLYSVFRYIIKLFYKIKNKLFLSVVPSHSGFLKFIENLTTIFVTIGSLFIAIGTMIKPIMDLISSYKGIK